MSFDKEPFYVVSSEEEIQQLMNERDELAHEVVKLEALLEIEEHRRAWWSGVARALARHRVAYRVLGAATGIRGYVRERDMSEVERAMTCGDDPR